MLEIPKSGGISCSLPGPIACNPSLRIISPVYKALPTITPVTPWGSKANKLNKSVTELTPPEAITGMEIAAASSRNASKLGPCSVPSRLISV